MTKLILMLVLLTGIWTDKFPKDVTGKWAVENVEVGDLGSKVPEQNKDMMIAMMKETFKNAIFTLKPDHSCAVSVAMPNMPEGNRWDYDAATGTITLSNPTDPKKRTLKIKVTEQGGKTYFTLQAAPVILRVHKA
jgi:hypothetical protein